MKRYLALARVSSREQEREGFSLDVQVDALRRYAEKNQGEIVKLYRIAETASKKDERKAFRELLQYAKQNSHQIDGILFYKVDRAARNLFDYVELEHLESEHGIDSISVTQPTENTPAGKLQRRILANMASFYTEQQSLDVREGLARRVQNGLFVSKAPYGYRNIRIDGRGLVEVHPENAQKIRRIFELYAYHNHTLDTLGKQLVEESVLFKKNCPTFSRGTLYKILTDRAYIGEVKHQGAWYPGQHEPIIDRATWNRVQAILGGKSYRCHEMTYAGEIVRCGHCGHPITGEVKTKKTRAGVQEYVYYRCSRYNSAHHPRTRLREEELDRQMLGFFDRMRVEDDEVREWFIDALRSYTRGEQDRSKKEDAELKRQHSLVQEQKNRLLDLLLLKEIEPDTYAKKATELRDREANLRLQLDACSRHGDEESDIVVKAFELSQNLRAKWVAAEFIAKRRILEIICLNLTLDDVTLVPIWRKPFDMLAEGLVLNNSRGDWI